MFGLVIYTFVIDVDANVDVTSNAASTFIHRPSLLPH